MAKQRQQERKLAFHLANKHEALLVKAEAIKAEAEAVKQMSDQMSEQLSTPTRPKPEFREEEQLGEERGALNRSTAERLKVSLDKVGCRNFPR